MPAPSRGQGERRLIGAIQFGPFELDRENAELRKQGLKVRLQPKPFRILCALVENPGVVVTREELRVLLWPEDTFVDFERSVNTAVNRLRLALGESAEVPRYIETLSRIGYRFIAPNQFPLPPPWTAGRDGNRLDPCAVAR
jgi:DNA-binding winged helix-turn-helix (wHTH) protein